VRCTERTDRRAGRRVLADLRTAIEHPRHDIPLSTNREEVERLRLGGRTDALASGIVASSPAERSLVAQRHHQMDETGGTGRTGNPVDEIGAEARRPS
jgi:hypothetical protein